MGFNIVKAINNKIGILVGICISAYGIWCVITQKVVAEGSQLKGAWQLVGFPAVLLGIVITVFGINIIYTAWVNRGKNS